MIEGAGADRLLVNNAVVRHSAPIESSVGGLGRGDGCQPVGGVPPIRLALPGMKARGWGRIVNSRRSTASAARPTASATSRPRPLLSV